MTSLAELRAIEEERVASERAAIVAAAEARRRAAEDAEARRAADAAAHLAAEREAVIARERAREAAEREVRLKVEAAEATERARLMAAIEYERVANELELRRAEVARKRPTWMVAVTAVAVIATAGFAWFAIDQKKTSEAAIENTKKADRIRQGAIDEKNGAKQQLELAQAELVALGGEMDKALVDLENARTAKEKETAAANLRRLRQDQFEAEARRQKAIEEQKRKDRVKKLNISEECKNNPLAKGCT